MLFNEIVFPFSLASLATSTTLPSIPTTSHMPAIPLVSSLPCTNSTSACPLITNNLSVPLASSVQVSESPVDTSPVTPSPNSFSSNSDTSSSSTHYMIAPGVTSFTTPSPLPPPNPSLPTNTHNMLTRAKRGITKPKIFSATLSSITEPKTIKEALKHPQWLAAMNAEYEALMKNHTWDLVPLPHGRRAIGCKWVFRLKEKPDGTIDRYKARLVAKGFHQQPGFDFHETFSPVIKPITVRTVLTIALSFGWSIRQLDVNNAFLNGHLHEEVFMTQPPGYHKGDDTLVCRLKKSLYGLKQAPRAWFAKLTSTLMSLGFVCSKSDNSLFVRKTATSMTYLLAYVDDIILTGSNTHELHTLISLLNAKFALKDLGDLHFFLGIHVTRPAPGQLHLCQ